MFSRDDGCKERSDHSGRETRMPSDSTMTTASIPPAVRWLIAAVLTFLGGIALAVGLGGILLPPEQLRAPLWIVAACGVSFGALGVAVALEGADRYKRLRSGLGLVFLLSFATVFNWIAFGPGERHFSGHTTIGVGGEAVPISAGESELTGRVVFGIVAVAVNLMIAVPLARAIGRRHGRRHRPGDRSGPDR
jgi:hypothetical protein